MIQELNRRAFLLATGAGVGAAWLAQTPAVMAAAVHARHAAKSGWPGKFEFFTPAEAAEVDAMAARIIPSDETPGAREAGAVYFIDHGLATFASEAQDVYRNGLPKLQAAVRQCFPAVDKFSAATPEQQDKILEALDGQSPKAVTKETRARPGAAAQTLFETVRVHTLTAFLVDPEAGGNRDGAGWKVIGRESAHAFQPPFGFYDRDYPGWRPGAASSGDKK